MIKANSDQPGTTPSVFSSTSDEASRVSSRKPGRQEHRQTSGAEPDWSWQDTAVGACIRSLDETARARIGLVVPTGGGKTRIALRIALQILQSNQDSHVVWVTHRRHLKRMAHRSLQQLTTDLADLPPGAARLLAQRIHFTMVGDSEKLIDDLSNVTLVVIDEAHHAAAASYEHLFGSNAPPALALTATPNRADGLPIGIHQVAYTTTYRELFRRKCVVEPTFHPPIDIEGLWKSDETIDELAQLLIDKTAKSFSKLMVATSRTSHLEPLFEALLSHLAHEVEHPLSAEDIGWVHAGGTSTSAPPEEFLDAFAAKPRGILIGTSSLLGEGMDDPNLDSVAITYPSQSIGHLMQVAGRVMRQAPGKLGAHVMQVHQSGLEYHFEQRWLYQEISDRLRPQVVDHTYGSPEQLQASIEQLLAGHNVASANSDRVVEALRRTEPGDSVSLMLGGIHYFEDVDDFATNAHWNAILCGAEERSRFVRIFNHVSDQDESLHEPRAFLERHMLFDPADSSLFMRYVDLIQAMEYARKETDGENYAGSDSRPYDPRQGTTWLRYYTFHYEPSIPLHVLEFLEDAVNADRVATEYQQAPDGWATILKIELPRSGAWAHLLDRVQSEWLANQLDQLVDALRGTQPSLEFLKLVEWEYSLPTTPIPQGIVRHINQLTRADRREQQMLNLTYAEERTQKPSPAGSAVGLASRPTTDSVEQ